MEPLRGMVTYRKGDEDVDSWWVRMRKCKDVYGPWIPPTQTGGRERTTAGEATDQHWVGHLAANKQRSGF